MSPRHLVPSSPRPMPQWVSADDVLLGGTLPSVGTFSLGSTAGGSSPFDPPEVEACLIELHERRTRRQGSAAASPDAFVTIEVRSSEAQLLTPRLRRSGSTAVAALPGDVSPSSSLTLELPTLPPPTPKWGRRAGKG